MIDRIQRGIGFVRTGLLGPVVKKALRLEPTVPRAPVLGPEVTLPWGALEEHRCFACSPRNASGLKLAFHAAPGFDLACRWTVAGAFENYPGMLHGGVAVTILDELLGQAIFHRVRHLPVSITAKVAWHKAVKMGDELVGAARITSQYDRFYGARGWLFRADGALAASVEGMYVTPSLGQFRKLAELETILPVAQGWFAPGRSKAGTKPAS